MIEYYKNTNNKEKQLLYVEHLLSVDSLINTNKYNLSTEINRKYDTQNLLNDKEVLISDLNTKNYKLYWAICFMILFTLVLFYLYIKNKIKVEKYKSRADYLLKKISHIEDTTQAFLINEYNSKIEITKNEGSKANIINDNILNQIKIKLLTFENEKRFLDSKLNLEILSKELNTNRVYLSKVINELKGQNFPQYLNTLRINHIINELKINKGLQKYTITAIAEEAGFNNSESFTNAFKKITGTLPSYFLKALQEK